jgi:hypothetical protein
MDRLRYGWKMATGAVGSGLRMLGSGTRRVGGFLRRQVSGTRRNLGRAWNYLTFDELLPPSIRDMLQWTIEIIPKLLGIRSTTPWQQIGAAISVVGFALLATFLTGGLLIGTVAIVLGFGAIGVARLIPAVNEEYGDWMAALPIKNDYDVPRWKRD